MQQSLVHSSSEILLDSMKSFHLGGRDSPSTDSYCSLGKISLSIVFVASDYPQRASALRPSFSMPTAEEDIKVNILLNR